MVPFTNTMAAAVGAKPAEAAEVAAPLAAQVGVWSRVDKEALGTLILMSPVQTVQP